MGIMVLQNVLFHWGIIRVYFQLKFPFDILYCYKNLNGIMGELFARCKLFLKSENEIRSCCIIVHLQKGIIGFYKPISILYIYNLVIHNPDKIIEKVIQPMTVLE